MQIKNNQSSGSHVYGYYKWKAPGVTNRYPTSHIHSLFVHNQLIQMPNQTSNYECKQSGCLSDESRMKSTKQSVHPVIKPTMAIQLVFFMPETKQPEVMRFCI